MVLYAGPSNIDGKEIIVKISPNSGNVKTGKYVQSYIMRAGIQPHHAVKTGEDESVCGQCPLRPSIGGGCYVLTFHGPRMVYNGKSDLTRETDKALKEGQGFRFGSYGDPTAVPLDVWKDLMEKADYSTGYTHQWREPYAQEYKGILQASCGSMAEVLEAKAMGWKVFATWQNIVKKDFQDAGLLATQCPSDPTLPSHRTCAECRLCNGKRADIWIKPHGNMKGRVK